MSKQAVRSYLVTMVAPNAACFVQHPEHHGCWVKTDASVPAVACPRCKAPKGVPCRGIQRAVSTLSHYERRTLAKRKRSSGC